MGSSVCDLKGPMWLVRTSECESEQSKSKVQVPDRITDLEKRPFQFLMRGICDMEVGGAGHRCILGRWNTTRLSPIEPSTQVVALHTTPMKLYPGDICTFLWDPSPMKMIDRNVSMSIDSWEGSSVLQRILSSRYM